MLRRLFTPKMGLLRTPYRSFAAIITFSPEVPKDHQKRSIIKICSILHTKYFEMNEDIPANYTVRVIDDDSGNLIGVFPVPKALLINQRTCE